MLSLVWLASICSSSRRRKRRSSQKTGEQLSSSGRPLRQSAAILKAHASNWRLIKGVHHWQSVDDGKGHFTRKAKCSSLFLFSPPARCFLRGIHLSEGHISRPFRYMLPHYPESTSRLLPYAGWLVVFRNAGRRISIWDVLFLTAITFTALGCVYLTEIACVVWNKSAMLLFFSHFYDNF